MEVEGVSARVCLSVERAAGVITFLRVLTHLKSFLYWVDPTIIIFTTTKPDSFIVLNSEIDIDQLLYCLSQKNVYKKRNLKLSFTSTSKTCFSHKQ